MEKRKEKSKVGHLLSARGTSERRKAAHDDRSGRRSDIIKRFRGVTQNSHEDAATRSAMDSFQSILLSIKSTDQAELLVPLSSLRHYMSCDDPPIQAVVDSGIIDDLIRILFYKNHLLTPDVIWCLSNIATGNHAQTGAVVKALPALLGVLQDCQSLPVNNDVQLTSSLQEDSCWVIGNIAGDSDDYRSALLNYGALQPLVDFTLQCIHDYRASAASENSRAAELCLSRANTAVWAISNIARGLTPGDIFIKSGVTGPLVDLLRSGSMSGAGELKLQSEICWFFAFLTAKDDATVNALMTQGLAEAFACAIHRADPVCLSTVPCLRVLVNLCSGLPVWAEHLLRQKTLLPSVLLHCNVLTAHKAVVKESLLLLRHLYGESEELRVCVLQSPSGPSLLECIAHALLSDVFDMQREAVFALQCACLHPAILDFFPSLHSTPILRQLVQLLHAHDTEVNMSCMHILRGASSHSPVVQVLAGLGLHDILDSIQYGPGDPAMVRAARMLAEDLFEREESEAEEDDAGMSEHTAHQQGGLGGGIRLQGESQSGSAASPAGPSGVGRGSHLLRPAWMTPM